MPVANHMPQAGTSLSEHGLKCYRVRLKIHKGMKP
jgi:hypothetical protein